MKHQIKSNHTGVTFKFTGRLKDNKHGLPISHTAARCFWPVYFIENAFVSVKKIYIAHFKLCR